MAPATCVTCSDTAPEPLLSRTTVLSRAAPVCSMLMLTEPGEFTLRLLIKDCPWAKEQAAHSTVPIHFSGRYAREFVSKIIGIVNPGQVSRYARLSITMPV